MPRHVSRLANAGIIVAAALAMSFSAGAEGELPPETWAIASPQAIIPAAFSFDSLKADDLALPVTPDFKIPEKAIVAADVLDYSVKLESSKGVDEVLAALNGGVEFKPFALNVPGNDEFGGAASFVMPIDERFSAAGSMDIFNAVLARSGRLERMPADEVEGWLLACGERIAAALKAAERERYAELAWSFWRRAYPARGMEAFVEWVGEMKPGSEADNILLSARLAGEAARKYRNDLLRIVDDPAAKDRRDDILFLLGSIEIRTDDPDGAGHLEKLIKEHHKSPLIPRARLLLAWTAMMDGREKEAAEYLRALIQETPDDPLVGRARQMLAGLEAAEQPATPAAYADEPDDEEYVF